MMQSPLSEKNTAKGGGWDVFIRDQLKTTGSWAQERNENLHTPSSPWPWKQQNGVLKVPHSAPVGLVLIACLSLSEITWHSLPSIILVLNVRDLMWISQISVASSIDITYIEKLLYAQ